VFFQTCAITAADVSGHIARPAGPNFGETIMRKIIISFATVATLIGFAGTSAVTAVSRSQFTETAASAHHQMIVKDAVRTVHPAHTPLLAS
jgi:hypothetical protein